MSLVDDESSSPLLLARIGRDASLLRRRYFCFPAVEPARGWEGSDLLTSRRSCRPDVPSNHWKHRTNCSRKVDRGKKKRNRLLGWGVRRMLELHRTIICRYGMHSPPPPPPLPFLGLED